MIKINLFPFRAARKRENIRRQIGYYVATVLILLAFMVIWSVFYLNSFPLTAWLFLGVFVTFPLIYTFF